MRRFYASPEQFGGDTITLSKEETRHLRDVLRLKPGDEVHVFDGEGREFAASVEQVGKSETVLRKVKQVEPAAPESNLDLTLAATVYKSDKLDLVIQKAVELGVATFVPIVSFRSEAKLRDAEKRVDRWRKIALEATKQCERARIMSVGDAMPFADFLERTSPGLKFFFSEKDGGSLPKSSNHKQITALVGPKGGWEDSEIDLAVEHSFFPIKLGRRIMRAETAAISFAALLQHRFGDLN
jgi:16S rRNA (uracil1498-N3)-methyltransferase